MRPLTFGGYLESYVAYLAGENTRDLKRLAELALVTPRLRAPLVLWAAETGRGERLTGLLRGRGSMHAELDEVVRLKRARRLERALSDPDSSLRAEYAKTWRSYVARRDAPKRDEDVKLAARQRALSLEKRKRVTRYRLAKDLGLNPGNLHAFLAQGNPSKVSRANALRVVRYLEAA